MSMWCYSLDGEHFNSGSYSKLNDMLKDAQKEANLEMENGTKLECIYAAKCEVPDNSSFYPNADEIINYMAIQADDVGGDYTNNYPDVSKAAEDELTEKLHELLDLWCNKYDVQPTFYSVSEPKKYNILTLKEIKRRRHE